MIHVRHLLSTSTLLGIVLAIGLVGCDSASPDLTNDAIPASQLESAAVKGAGSAVGPVLAAVRRATAPYHRVQAAIDDQYTPSVDCVPQMGFHYANFGLIDAEVDPSAPEILVYAPHKNGGLKLVAAEFMVAAAPWDAAHAGPPTLAGQAFDDHRDPAHWHGVPFAHYDLHAWVWQNNPDGVFAAFNPTVSCE